MKLSEVIDILAPLHVQLVGYDPKSASQVFFTALGLHSKKMIPGSLFVAIPGEKEDGARYALEAVTSGATAVITQNRMENLSVPQLIVSDARAAAADLACAWSRHPARQLACFGITGTNGKTTTSYILRSILEAAGHKVGLFGTVGYFLLDRAIPAPNTTPDPVTLQGYLRELVDSGGDCAVMEVSSHSLMQNRVRGIPFRAGIFTNLSPEHLDYHRTLEEYLRAKSRLFESLAPDAAAVLNVEDVSSMELKKRTRGRVVSYGIERSDAHFRAQIHSMGMNGVNLSLLTPDGEVSVRFPLTGRHNVMNLLAAAAAARSYGVKLDQIARGAERMKVIPGRLERIESAAPFTVLVDYAHTDDAIEKVLHNLRPLTRGRLIIVFGCGGDRDRTKRPRMGRVATELADFAVITSDNPRTEDPLVIIGEILAGVRTAPSRYQVEPDRRKAIARAIEMAKSGDVVLIAGKGHENYQIVGKNVFPFDDREVAREVLRGTL